MSNLASIATDLISHMGYTGIGLGLLIDSFSLPIPSEVLLPLGGALAHQGRFNFWLLLLVAVIAQTAGGLIGYLIGRYGGEPLLLRYGRYVLITQSDLEKIHRVFTGTGRWMVLAGRCVPVVRGLICYPAGIAEMNIYRYLIYTAIGSLGWSALLAGLGYALSGSLEKIQSSIGGISYVVAAAVLLAVVWHVVHKLREIRLERKGGTSDTARNDAS